MRASSLSLAKASSVGANTVMFRSPVRGGGGIQGLFKHTGSDPPENCQLIVKNCQKLDIFFKKIGKNFHFFKKIAIGNFFEKNEHFWQFFLKKCQVFGNFLTVKWQFSRGSGSQQ